MFSLYFSIMGFLAYSNSEVYQINNHLINFCFSLKKLLKFIFVIWFLASTYLYSSQHSLLFVNLVNFWIFAFIYLFVELPENINYLYISISFVFLVANLAYGCLFCNGFFAFTVAIAKSIINLPHNSLTTQSFSVFWVNFVENILPKLQNQLRSEISLLGKLKQLHLLIYSLFVIILLVTFGAVFSHFLILLLLFNLYFSGIWFILWPVLSIFFIVNLGLNLLVFDLVWVNNIQTILGGNACHLFGYNSPGESFF